MEYIVLLELRTVSLSTSCLKSDWNMQSCFPGDVYERETDGREGKSRGTPVQVHPQFYHRSGHRRTSFVGTSKYRFRDK